MENSNKIESHHWFMLFSVAALFDLLGWVLLLGIDELTFGIAGVLLNLFAGLIFITWAILWMDKGLGNPKFFKTFLMGFLVEEIPWVGAIVPTWIAVIYRIKRAYNNNASPQTQPSGVKTKTIKQRPKIK